MATERTGERERERERERGAAMLKLHTVEQNWRTLLESLDSIREHLRDNFDHYDKVFRRCDRYFMQKHGRRADTLHDVIVILNCRSQARAQVFLNDSDFDSLIILLNQFYRLRDVHNAITSQILKPIYRYYYLYFSQDRRHERQLESVINAANTAKIFINSVQEEGDQRRFGPKPFGKEEVKPHRKVWHVLSFLENSLLGLRPILEQLEDWQLEHRLHLNGQEIDFLEPWLSYRYGRVTESKPAAADDEDPGTLRGRRLDMGRQRQRQHRDEPRRWEDQLRIHGEPIKAAPTFPKRFGGMVNNYLSSREDHYLQQRVDSYWEQEASLDEWRRRPVIQQQRPQQQQPLLAIAAPPNTSSRGSRFQDPVSGRYLEHVVVQMPPVTRYRSDQPVESSRHGPSVFITEEDPAPTGGPADSRPGSNADTPRVGRTVQDSSGGTTTRLPPLGQPLPRLSADAPVRAVRGFDPDTYLEELRATEAKLQVVAAALKQQEAESADLLAKMSGGGRGTGGGGGDRVQTGSQQQQSFDWLQVLRQEKEASIHSLRQRMDLLNFQKKLILSRLQAPLFTY